MENPEIEFPDNLKIEFDGDIHCSRQNRRVYKFCVFDNGGKTFDRYTVFLQDSVYTMSRYPFNPQGFSQYLGEEGEKPKGDGYLRGRHLGDYIACIEQLPKDVYLAIRDRIQHEEVGILFQGARDSIRQTDEYPTINSMPEIEKKNFLFSWYMFLRVIELERKVSHLKENL